MSKRSNKLSAEDQRLKDIEDAVRAVRADPNNYDNLWGLFRLGHLAFRQGLGLPVEAVEQSIQKGMKN